MWTARALLLGGNVRCRGNVRGVQDSLGGDAVAVAGDGQSGCALTATGDACWGRLGDLPGPTYSEGSGVAIDAGSRRACTWRW